MTVADLIALLQSCPEPGAFVSINSQEYHPTGFRMADYGRDGHPLWACEITVDIGAGEDFHAAYDAAHGRPRRPGP